MMYSWTIPFFLVNLLNLLKTWMPLPRDEADGPGQNNPPELHQCPVDSLRGPFPRVLLGERPGPLTPGDVHAPPAVPMLVDGVRERFVDDSSVCDGRLACSRAHLLLQEEERQHGANDPWQSEGGVPTVT